MTRIFSRRSHLIYWLLFIALEGVFIFITILSYDKQNIRILLLLYLLSFLPFVLALYIGPSMKLSLRMILTTALVFRLTLLASFPVFSDDVFRYLWEGKMQLNGINPYLVAPADPTTEPFRDAYWKHINHKTIPTIYPPLSELFFRLCMGLFYNLYFFKGMLIVLDMGVLAFLVCIAKNRAIPLFFLLIHAWHPLVIIEIAGSGHQDIIGMFFLAGCLYFWQKQNIWGSASMLTASFLSKLFPLFLFPLLFRNKGKLPYLMLFALTMLLYLPFYSSDYHLFKGLAVYSKTWQANGSVFYVTNLLINNVFKAKVAIGLLFSAIYLFTYFRLREFDTACFVALGSFLILSPTLHPWYLLWVIPLLVIIPNKAWLWLTLSAAVYYHALIDYFEKGVWEELILIKMLIFIPFFVLLALSLLNKKRPSHA